MKKQKISAYTGVCQTVRLPPIRSSGRRAQRGELVLVLRRGYSAPESITVFAAGAAAVGTIYPTLMIYTHGHGLPCPLRALTGVPCPFCGLTTATVALVHGQWQAAAAASPLVYLVAALAAGTIPVLLARAFGLAGPPRPWSGAARRRTGWMVAVAVALSWLYQLHRFGFL